jgi:hypothetical protein
MTGGNNRVSLFPCVRHAVTQLPQPANRATLTKWLQSRFIEGVRGTGTPGRASASSWLYEIQVPGGLPGASVRLSADCRLLSSPSLSESVVASACGLGSVACVCGPQGVAFFCLGPRVLHHSSLRCYPFFY